MTPTQPPRSELIETLKAISFLRGLDDSILEEVADAALWRVYRPGAPVFWEGEQSAGLYYLCTGWLKVVKSSLEGREQVLRFLGPGETFNEVGVLADRPNPATAIALEEATLWLIERAALRRLFLAHPDVALRVLENMADRVAGLVQLVADLSLHSVEVRLARFLLEQAEGDEVVRRRWNTQSELAARLGTVPDVLSRALRTLSEAGLIAVDRQRIQILDPAALGQRAQLAL